MSRDNLEFPHVFRDYEDFVDDFWAIRNAMVSGKRFALARFADGERALLEGKPLVGCDGWESPTTPEFQRALRDALTYSDNGWHLGISCRCCDLDSHVFYLRHASIPISRITFSNLFANANRSRATSLIMKDILVAPVQGKMFADMPFIRVPLNCVGDLGAVDYIVQQLKSHTHRVNMYGPERTKIFVAAGPAACIIAHRYWMSCCDPLPIIDIGSAFDTVIHGHPTRGYHHEDSPTANKVCVW